MFQAVKGEMRGGRGGRNDVIPDIRSLNELRSHLGLRVRSLGWLLLLVRPAVLLAYLDLLTLHP